MGWGIGTKTSVGTRVRVTDGCGVGVAVSCPEGDPEGRDVIAGPVSTGEVGDFVPVS